MATTNIPNTTLNVSSLCLGTGAIGSSIPEGQAFQLLDQFVELGGNFIDTARVYGPQSASERVIGAWMQARKSRGRIVLGTKGAHWQQRDAPRLARQDIEEDLNGSLSDLRTDFIDLYWLHRDDPTRPVGDIMETLNDQVRVGKVRFFGASNWKMPRLRAAQEYAAAHGLAGFAADQFLWNAAVLAGPPYGDPTTSWMDDERAAYHRETGMAAVPYQSQAYGLFQRMHAGTLEQMNAGFREFYRPGESRRRYEQMRDMMDRIGLTITQVVLGYLIGQPFVTVPIVGCHSPQQLADSMRAADVRLTPEQVQAIEAVAAYPEKMTEE